jgi:CRP-like cAMP-binding protein
MFAALAKTMTVIELKNKNEALFEEGDSADYFYFVLKGCLKLTNLAKPFGLKMVLNNNWIAPSAEIGQRQD